MVCVLNFSQPTLEVQLGLNRTFIGPRRGIDQWWFSWMHLVEHLEHSIWTIELKHALEVFSLSNYLNWFDYEFNDLDKGWLLYQTDFPEKFLRYLEHKVSEPCSQTEFQLKLPILDRENLTFITTICCVIWSILTLPSKISQLGRNSAS